MYTRRDPPERRWHALCSAAGPSMSFRFASLSLAALARRMVPVRAVVDGVVGEEGVVVVAPEAP